MLNDMCEVNDAGRKLDTGLASVQDTWIYSSSSLFIRYEPNARTASWSIQVIDRLVSAIVSQACKQCIHMRSFLLIHFVPVMQNTCTCEHLLTPGGQWLGRAHTSAMQRLQASMWSLMPASSTQQRLSLIIFMSSLSREAKQTRRTAEKPHHLHSVSWFVSARPEPQCKTAKQYMIQVISNVLHRDISRFETAKSTCMNIPCQSTAAAIEHYSVPRNQEWMPAGMVAAGLVEHVCL